MAEQSQAIKTETGGAADGNAPGSVGFPARGVPIITGINRVGLWSLYVKEVRRFFKVQTQTVWAPAVTTLLFLVIFTVAMGRTGREVLGVPFATFVAPGLIVMGMMQNAFANSSFSFLSGKIQGTIIDLLMPPLSVGELMTGIVAAAAWSNFSAQIEVTRPISASMIAPISPNQTTAQGCAIARLTPG